MFKRGIHIEVDEKMYKKIAETVEQMNRASGERRMSMSRFVKELVDDWVSKKGEQDE